MKKYLDKLGRTCSWDVVIEANMTNYAKMAFIQMKHSVLLVFDGRGPVYALKLL